MLVVAAITAGSSSSSGSCSYGDCCEGLFYSLQICFASALSHLLVLVASSENVTCIELPAPGGLNSGF